MVDGSAGCLLKGVNAFFEEDDELILSCDWMFCRYFNDEMEQENCFATGDFAKFGDDGNLFIEGRKKDLIIKGGTNISPARIEALLGKLDLPEFCVVGKQDKIFGEKIVLTYVGDKPLLCEKISEINTILLQELGKSYLIDAFILLGELPKNQVGKLDKKKISKLI